MFKALVLSGFKDFSFRVLMALVLRLRALD
jgi:hypothetical protein